MKIRLENIPEEGRIFNETRPAEWLTNFPELVGGRDMSVAGSVSFSIKVVLMGDQVQVTGEITVPVKAECARCLEEVVSEVTAPVDFVLVPVQPDFDDEEVEDVGYGTYSGEEIDFSELLRGQLALHFPVRFLCGGECKGICPQCGADLNREACNCKKEIADPRWAALNKLKL